MRLRKTKSLAGRFVKMLCFTFVPMGVIAVVVASIVVGISSEQTYEAYKTDLSGAMTRIETHLDGAERAADRLVTDNIAVLTLENDHKDIFNYEFVQSLEDGLEDQLLPGFVFLFDHGQRKLYTDYDYHTYTGDEMSRFRRKIITRGFPGETTGGWKLYFMDDRCFLIRIYGFSEYTLGVFVDFNQLTEDMDLMEELMQGDIYATDHTKIVLRGEDGIEQVRHRKWEDLLMDTAGYRYITWDSDHLNLQIAIKIPTMTIYQKVAGYFALLVVVVLLEVLFLAVFWKMMNKNVTRPIERMNEALTKIGTEEHYRITGIDDDESTEFRAMFENFNEMMQELEEGREKSRKLYDVTVDNLKLRVSPHMLLNSFNLIYSMAQVEDYKSIQEFSLYLVDYFRYVLKETETMVPVAKEMDFVRSYLGIQKMRFPNRFNSVYNMSKDCRRALIPPLLIENFVENAIKYALIPGKVIEILINIRREGQRLYISVIDTGSGIKKEVQPFISSGQAYVDKLGNSHIGILNCRKRVDYYYGGKGHINIISREGAGTQIWMDLPYLEEKFETKR